MKNFMYHNQIVHHKPPYFKLFILHNNLFDNQGNEINKSDIFCSFRHTVYIYAIMKTMCPPGYHHNGLVIPRALGHMMYGLCILLIYVYIYIHIYIYIYIYIYICTWYSPLKDCLK